MSESSQFIPFNKPFLIGKELEYITLAVKSGHLAANGFFTGKCNSFFQEKYSVSKTILTNSCTSALELASIVLDIKPGDEIIAPSYTFVSTVNPFVLRGAKIVFADSSSEHPNIDANCIEALITSKTKAIVCVHYAGIACDMEKLMEISKRTGIPLIEDAAHAIESKWNGSVQLGTIGKFGAFSFHDSKNIIAGEGGLLFINDKSFVERAEWISEKGTNRAAFFRGELNKYEWVSVGSSFLSSELSAAFLYAQLEKCDEIQQNRLNNWNLYHTQLNQLEADGFIKRPYIPSYAMSNGHIYYLVCKSLEEREKLRLFLKSNAINAVFHYQSLHKSPFYQPLHDGRDLPNADRYTDCLLRLPMYYGLQSQQVLRICTAIKEFFKLSK